MKFSGQAVHSSINCDYVFVRCPLTYSLHSLTYLAPLMHTAHYINPPGGARHQNQNSEFRCRAPPGSGIEHSYSLIVRLCYFTYISKFLLWKWYHSDICLFLWNKDALTLSSNQPGKKTEFWNKSETNLPLCRFCNITGSDRRWVAYHHSKKFVTLWIFPFLSGIEWIFFFNE